MTKKVRQIVAIVLLAGIVGLLVVLGTRSSNTDAANGKIQVVTTYYPLYNFAVNVGGDNVSVTNITPAGAEPHEYEPTPGQLAIATKSDAFIYNGGNFEPWTSNFVKDYKHTVIKSSASISMMTGEAEPGEEPAGAVNDPHFWLDPVLAQTMVDTIRDGLSKADPANSKYYAERAANYKAKLTALNNDFIKGLSTCKLRTIVTSHTAFNYLAKRYNLEVLAIAGMSPEEEPSAAKLAELSNLVNQKGIDYIFFESLVSPKMAETIANETGAKTLVLDPIEGMSDDDQKQGKDYISVQHENLQNLRTALACN